MKLPRLNLRKTLTLLLPALLALAAACGGSAGTSDGGGGGLSVVADAAERQTPPTDTIAVSNAGVELQEWGAGAALDPAEVVAAHGVVLNRIYNRLLPAVVHIDSYTLVTGSPFGFMPPSSGGDAGPQQFPSQFVRGEGSGFVWSEDGHIVTSHHVVAGATRVTVTFHDGAIIEAEVLGGDVDSDLAVLKLAEPRGDLAAVSLGDSDDAKVGELVAAIGSPFGREFTLTSGIVSAAGRTLPAGNLGFSLTGVIQTDAAINPGSSGGPLLDMNGGVIGINARIASSSGVSAGVGFAVPVNAAKVIIPSLIAKGEYSYSWLGIRGAHVTPQIAGEMELPEDTRGVLVVETIAGGPAAKAGMRGASSDSLDGDVIVAIDGNPVVAMDDIIGYLLIHTAPGDAVTLEVIRDGRDTRVRMKATLGERPRQP